MSKKHKISLRESKDCKAQLYIIPHAGGNYSQFLSWNNYINPELETVFLELPYRGSNFNEKNYQENPINWQKFIDESFDIISDQEAPAIFFGHSFGSLIAFELIKKLERIKNFKNTVLITSACFAPTAQNLKNLEPISQLNDHALLNRIKKFGAITDELMENHELSSYFVKVLRSDLSMMENFVSMDNLALNCPIYTYLGIDDPVYSIEQMEDWKVFTHNKFQLKVFPSDHFYVLKEVKVVTNHINEIFNLLQNKGV